MALGGANRAAADVPAGHVYVQTNDAAGNAVVAFERSADGTLTYDETVPTGGLGVAPTGLGSQAALALTAGGDHLLAVNAGSDDVSVFGVTNDGLRLADVEPVGDCPVSVAVHGEIVYVLNQGDDTIQGLRMTDSGTLTAIQKSTRPPGTNAAQVAFSPDGRLLAVTEKATQTIDTFVWANGRARRPERAGLSGLSVLSVISASVPNSQGAACWLVVTSDARCAYTAIRRRRVLVCAEQQVRLDQRVLGRPG